MKSAYLSLGSNLGDRSQNLARALELLNASGVQVVKQSSVYETEPQDIQEQPSFLNMVVAVATELTPLELLRAALSVENKMGRVRVVRGGTRLIDADVLLIGDLVMETAELVIPHPRMWQRRFVLEPLLELEPTIRDPQSGRFAQEFMGGVLDQRVVQVSTKQ